jgi:hypothetical protein
MHENLTRTVGVINLSQFLHLHLDSYILKRYLSPIYINRDSGSGQISAKETIKSPAGIAKTAPWWLVRRDNFSAKVLGSGTGGQRHQRLLPQPPGRWVLFYRTRKP